MPIIEWNVGFMIGIKEVDQRHKQLVQMLNERYDEFRGGAKLDQSILENLVHYANDIFGIEERLMVELGYPNYVEHKKEHESFLSRVGGFRSSVKQGKDISIEVLWFLCNWVTHHMRETDADLGHFVDIQNISKRIKHSRAPGGAGRMGSS